MGSKYTDAQKKASMKYLAQKTDDISLRVPKGKKAEYKTYAQKQGKSLTALITELLEADMLKNGEK